LLAIDKDQMHKSTKGKIRQQK